MKVIHGLSPGVDKKPHYKMTRWGVVNSNSSPYVPPELHGIKLCGRVNGPHPVAVSGFPIQTSAIVGSSGMEVETINSVYTLDGPPSPYYKKYLEENSIAMDEVWPVKVWEFKVTPMPDDQQDVHTEHCCEEHKSCKYGDKDCPVATGVKYASYDCNCGW